MKKTEKFFSREVWSFKNVRQDIGSLVVFAGGLILFYIFRAILQSWFSKPVSGAIALTINIPYYFVPHFFVHSKPRISFIKYTGLIIALMIALLLLDGWL